VAQIDDLVVGGALRHPFRAKARPHFGEYALGLVDEIRGKVEEMPAVEFVRVLFADRFQYLRDVADAMVVQRAAGENFERGGRELVRERLQDLRQGLAQLRFGREDGADLLGGERAALDVGIPGGNPDVFDQ
jgi:hypothetical protein